LGQPWVKQKFPLAKLGVPEKGQNDLHVPRSNHNSVRSRDEEIHY